MCHHLSGMYYVYIEAAAQFCNLLTFVLGSFEEVVDVLVGVSVCSEVKYISWYQIIIHLV